MSKKDRNYIKLTAASFVSVFMLSGCSSMVEMSDSQMKVIADYAADVLVRYDASYYERFAKEDKKIIVEDNILTASNESEAPSTAPPDVSEVPASEEPVVDSSPTEQTPAESSEPLPEANVAAGLSPSEVGEVFGLKDVDISYKGYEVTDQYPNVETGQVAFQMKATDNHKLYVFSFELLNTSQEAKNCNILGQNIKFRIRVNDTDNLNVQKTLLLEDLAQMNAVLQPMESKNTVVICQVPADYNPEMSSLSMIVRTGGEDKEIKLQ